MCPFLFMCLQMCQQHAACQGSRLGTQGTPQRLQRQPLILPLSSVYSYQFFDSTGVFCLIYEDEKEASFLQYCLIILLQLIEKRGSIRRHSLLELFQQLDRSCKTRRSISTVSQYCKQSTRERSPCFSLLPCFAS